MAQFDIYQRPGAGVEFLLELQDDMLSDLSTRVVAPLAAPEDVGPSMTILNPRIFVDGAPYILLTHLLAAVSTSVLGEPCASAGAQRDEIIGAIDLLFKGI